jgi:chromosome segregation ATPase
VKNKLLSFEEKVNLDGRLIEDYQNRLSCSGVEIEQLRSEVAELNQNLVKNGKNHRH